MNGVFSGFSYKSKTTGEFITVISTCSDGTVTYAGADGVSITVKSEKFLKEYEPYEVDYKKWAENIAEACRQNWKYSQMADAILRRITPGYYEEGKVVYFERSDGFFGIDNNNYRSFGPDQPFIIAQIVPDSQRKVIAIRLVRKGRNYTKESYIDHDFELLAYLDHVEPNDAFWLLRRYDQPY